MDGSVNLGQIDGEIYFNLFNSFGGDPWMEGIILVLSLISDRGTEQHRKISAQVRLFTEGRKYSNFL